MMIVDPPHSPKRQGQAVATTDTPHTCATWRVGDDDRDGALSALAVRCSQTHRGLTSLTAQRVKCTTCAARA